MNSKFKYSNLNFHLNFLGPKPTSPHQLAHPSLSSASVPPEPYPSHCAHPALVVTCLHRASYARTMPGHVHTASARPFPHYAHTPGAAPAHQALPHPTTKLCHTKATPRHACRIRVKPCLCYAMPMRPRPHEFKPAITTQSMTFKFLLPSSQPKPPP